MENIFPRQLASWILKNYKGKDLTQLKLQKLLFYSYFLNNALSGDLFDEIEFEAWEHGPVNRSLRSDLKSYNRNPIDRDHYNGNDFNFKPTEKQWKLLQAVLNTYGKISPIRLIAQTHKDIDESWGSFQVIDNARVIEVYREMYSAESIKAPEMLFNALSFEIDGIQTSSFSNIYEMAEFFGEDRLQT